MTTPKEAARKNKLAIKSSATFKGNTSCNRARLPEVCQASVSSGFLDLQESAPLISSTSFSRSDSLRLFMGRERKLFLPENVLVPLTFNQKIWFENTTLPPERHFCKNISKTNYFSAAEKEAICIRSHHSYNKHVGFFLIIAQTSELLHEFTRSWLCNLKFIPTAPAILLRSPHRGRAADRPAGSGWGGLTEQQSVCQGVGFQFSCCPLGAFKLTADRT